MTKSNPPSPILPAKGLSVCHGRSEGPTEDDILQTLSGVSSLELKTELNRILSFVRDGQNQNAEQSVLALLSAIDTPADVWIHRDWQSRIDIQARAIALISKPDEVYRDVLVSELLASLDRATQAAEPFRHFVIDTVFSTGTYVALLLSAPHVTLMTPLASPEYLSDGHYQRYQVAITPKAFRSAHRRVRKAWHAITAAFQDPRVVHRICGLLEIDCPDKWKVHTRLQLDRAGARIRPHRDGENGGLLTFQMYFPLNRDNYETGTTFFDKTPDGFNPTLKMPFKSNFAYAFAIGDNSWHGSDAPLSTLSEGRLSLIMRLRADP